MSKHKFTDEEHYAAWEEYGGKCYWCGRPIDLFDVTIDHLIPEDLIDEPDILQRVKTEYRLSSNFNLNDFENWVPCHANCNSRKGNELFDLSPIFLATLRDAKRRASRARETKKKILDGKTRSRVLMQLKAAIKKGTVGEQDILPLFQLKEDRSLDDFVPGQQLVFGVAPGWKVVERQGNIATVIQDGRVGIVSALPNPDVSWMCPFCGNYGPWNGVICMSCGHRSDPSD